jgi:hypothetical protein
MNATSEESLIILTQIEASDRRTLKVLADLVLNITLIIPHQITQMAKHF